MKVYQMNKTETGSVTYTFCLEQLPNIIQELHTLLVKHRVIALHGDLGAGKTTFTAALCRYLGTHDKADSPTFSLINQYSFEDEKGTEQIIYHTDWYRIKDEEEARVAGIEDMLESSFYLCFIEWPENAPALLPEYALHIWLQPGNVPEERILKITTDNTSEPV